MWRSPVLHTWAMSLHHRTWFNTPSICSLLNPSSSAAAADSRGAKGQGRGLREAECSSYSLNDIYSVHLLIWQTLLPKLSWADEGCSRTQQWQLGETQTHNLSISSPEPFPPSHHCPDEEIIHTKNNLPHPSQGGQWFRDTYKPN